MGGDYFRLKGRWKFGEMRWGGGRRRGGRYVEWECYGVLYIYECIVGWWVMWIWERERERGDVWLWLWLWLVGGFFGFLIYFLFLVVGNEKRNDNNVISVFIVFNLWLNLIRSD